MAGLELILRSEVLVVFIYKLSARSCCRVNFSNDQVILFSEHLELRSAAVWRQPAFKRFPCVCSITEYYGLILDRNNQYDLESRISLTR